MRDAVDAKKGDAEPEAEEGGLESRAFKCGAVRLGRPGQT
jgi:hypothetical protein